MIRPEDMPFFLLPTNLELDAGVDAKRFKFTGLPEGQEYIAFTKENILYSRYFEVSIDNRFSCSLATPYLDPLQHYAPMPTKVNWGAYGAKSSTDAIAFAMVMRAASLLALRWDSHVDMYKEKFAALKAELEERDRKVNEEWARKQEQALKEKRELEEKNAKPSAKKARKTKK